MTNLADNLDVYITTLQKVEYKIFFSFHFYFCVETLGLVIKFLWNQKTLSKCASVHAKHSLILLLFISTILVTRMVCGCLVVLADIITASLKASNMKAPTAQSTLVPSKTCKCFCVVENARK